MRRLVFAALFLALLLESAGARAAETDDSSAPANNSFPANEKLKGFRYVLKTGLTYQKPDTGRSPPVSQDITFTISNHFGWGIPIGPIVLSPGASVPVYFFDAGTEAIAPLLHQPGATLGVLGEIEVHLPLKWFSIYGVAGAGGAFHFASNTQGGVFRGGGGIMVYPMSWIGIGAQATFLGMSNAARGPDTGLQALEITWPLELRF